MAMVLSAFVPNTIAQVCSVVKGEVTKQLGVTGEAKKLIRRLERVAQVLDDAEKRAAQGDDGVGQWLEKVRRAVYDADDIVDRCRMEARRLTGREQQALPRLLLSCCDTSEPRHEIATNVKNLNLKMGVIIKEKSRLQLQPSITDTPERRVRRHKSRLLESDIIGTSLENDTDKLVKRLTETEGQDCGLVAIVGNDGIGKTTLAKKIYDDERIRRSFDTRSWVCVSKDYNETSLLSMIIDSIGGDARDTQESADLESMLASLVAKRRFLLVLDDVCYCGVWEDLLQKPLKQGAHGSKVLVTARHRSIAREMGAAHVHRVKKMSIEDGWLLLCRAACLTEENDIETMKDVGMKIVEKCGGLPLAIKAIAGLLRTREAVTEEWKTVHESQAWSIKGLPEDVMKALYLCYDDLPSHLKQCFLYCSLFPSDFTMGRRALVQQWISEGFVQIRKDSNLEEVAEEYYEELVGRNLLQPETGYYDTARCRMHDVVWSLAQLVSQGEDLSGDAQRLSDDALFMPRRVSLARKRMAAIPDEIKRLEGLRTLLLPMNPLTTEGDMFTRLQHLKVLDLSETAIELIPETIGSLVYLRYLNLSQTSIQAIPESIGNLWSLKFLVLRECTSLHALPRGIEHLKGLRNLDLAGTVIDDAPFRVGQLRNLTSLQCFVVTSKEARAPDRNAWPLDELKNLFQLRTLHIQKLEKASDRSEAREAALGIKTCLKELELSCSSSLSPFETPTVVRKIEGVFEELCPPQILESLKIASYLGTKYPTWLSAIFLPNLRRVDLISCNFCQSLPPLGRLPQLKFLSITDSSALKEIDAEFMGTVHHHQAPFPKLENLHLQGLHKLETWSDIKAGALPSLQALQLESCPELRYLPTGLRHATSLTELRILDAASLETVENLVALKELGVWNTRKLRKISYLPSLEDLNISYCPALRTVEKVDSLQAIHIFDYNLQEMPRWIGLHASRLRSLDITGTVKLLSRCLVDGPDWPIIRDIPQVYGYSSGASYISYKKSPFSFHGNLNSEAVEEGSQENPNMEENASSAPSAVETDHVDDVSRLNRNVHGETKVKFAEDISASGGADSETSGFFDSKLIESEAPKMEENVSVDTAGALRSKSRRTHRRTRKLAEVVPEDAEVEAGADSVVLFPSNSTGTPEVVENASTVVVDYHTENHAVSSPSNLIRGESRAIGTDETGRDSPFNLARQDSRAQSVRTRRQTSKKGKYVSADADTVKDNSATRSSDTVTRRSADTANKISDTAAAKKYATEMTKTISAETVKSVSAAATGVRSENNGTSPLSSLIREESRATGFSEAGHDLPANLVRNEQQTSKKGNDVSADAGAVKDTSATPSPDTLTRRSLDMATKISATAAATKNTGEKAKEVSADTEVNVSASSIAVHAKKSSNLIRGESQAIGITEVVHDLPANLAHSKRPTLNKGEDISADSGAAKDHSATFSSYTDTRRVLDTANIIPSTVAANKSTSEMAKNVPTETVENVCAAAIGDHTKNSDANLPSNSIHGESKAPDVTETGHDLSADSAHRDLSTNLVRGERQTRKKGDVSADTGADEDSVTRTILDMANKISAAVASKNAAEMVKNASAETAKKIARAQSHAIDITETSKKAEDTIARGSFSSKPISGRIHGMASKFSTSVAANKHISETVKNAPREDDAYFSIEIEASNSHLHSMQHRAPKVYTAIVADTDTESAIRFSSMQQYHKSPAPRRRRRRRWRTYTADDKWSFGPMLMEKLREWLLVILLFSSLVQLLFIFWLLQRLLNQK